MLVVASIAPSCLYFIEIFWNDILLKFYKALTNVLSLRYFNL